MEEASEEFDLGLGNFNNFNWNTNIAFSEESYENRAVNAMVLREEDYNEHKIKEERKTAED